MLILPKSCFLHVPKTGGSWAKAAIRASGIECEEYAVNGDPHIELKDCPCPEKFKIAFVRHPVQLYRSYWRFKMGSGWDTDNPVDRDCRSTDFQTFVKNVLRRHPGICSRSFENFVGSPGKEIEFIGRYENLVEDLILGLQRAGESFDEGTIIRYPPQNVSDRKRFPAILTPELERLIKEKERDAMERFGYS